MLDYKWILGGLITLLLLNGCNDEGAGCFDKTGEEKTVDIDVPAFTTIDVASNVDVLLLSNGADEVQLTAGENLLSGISLKVEEGVLKIDNHNNCFWSTGYKHPLVTIRNAGLEKIEQHGYGTVKSTDTLQLTNLFLHLEDASGAIDLLVNANEVRVVSNNIGPITLAGVAQKLHAGHYWSDGILYAKNLKVVNCSIDHNGSNRMELNVSGRLEGQMTNYGDVYLYGQRPVEEVVEVMGEGRVVEEF